MNNLKILCKIFYANPPKSTCNSLAFIYKVILFWHFSLFPYSLLAQERFLPKAPGINTIDTLEGQQIVTYSHKELIPSNSVASEKDCSLIENLGQDTIFQVQASKNRPPLLSKLGLKQMAVPVIFLGVGFAGMGSKPLWNINEEIQEEIQEHYSSFHTKLDNYSQHVPLVAVYSLNLAGIKGKHDLINFTALYALSTYMSKTISKNLKSVTHQMRPDNSTADAFPSGHVTSAFTKATLMYLEYKDRSIWYGVGGYTIATATGALRLLNNKHWLSDVLAGAGIGIISTHVVYAVYPFIQNKISQRLPKLSNKNILILPAFENGSAGMGLIYQLK
ncbi:phosphatase PAP2 family protein (plasmid) [Adhaeribacter swui]|uniref:Phosphatase PAP2 family protein n=1 Tax=Adhaeribacter swui TaxID=2086471 RepID=A0A7G7G210_9BACT|nr:phosphatase PAP2 family protein [Adhaeribacter swui]QNF31194.1 phosphatase PAP2 family protein [Adhaeribacter swui]